MFITVNKLKAQNNQQLIDPTICEGKTFICDIINFHDYSKTIENTPVK